MPLPPLRKCVQPDCERLTRGTRCVPHAAQNRVNAPKRPFYTRKWPGRSAFTNRMIAQYGQEVSK